MSLVRVSTILALIVLAGSAAAYGIGDIGPAQAIHVRHASLLQQIPGVTGSVLTMRGIVEFPAFEGSSCSFPWPTDRSTWPRSRDAPNSWWTTTGFRS